MPTTVAAAPTAAEARRHGLATKLGAGGASALVTAAIVDAIVSGHVDADTTRAALGAVVMALVVMVGKYAQAVAAIVAQALERRAGSMFAGELGDKLEHDIADRVGELEQAVVNLIEDRPK